MTCNGNMNITLNVALVSPGLFWGVMQRRVLILYRRFLTVEDGTDTLSRNVIVGKGLPLDAA
jgi:hypothetical protein